MKDKKYWETLRNLLMYMDMDIRSHNDALNVDGFVATAQLLRMHPEFGSSKERHKVICKYLETLPRGGEEDK